MNAATRVHATVAGTGIKIRFGDAVLTLPFAAAVDLQHELDHAIEAICSQSNPSR